MTLSDSEMQTLIQQHNAKYCLGPLRAVFWSLEEYYHLIDHPDESRGYIARKKEQNLVALFNTEQQLIEFKKAHLPRYTFHTILCFD